MSGQEDVVRILDRASDAYMAMGVGHGWMEALARLSGVATKTMRDAREGRRSMRASTLGQLTRCVDQLERCAAHMAAARGR